MVALLQVDRSRYHPSDFSVCRDAGAGVGGVQFDAKSLIIIGDMHGSWNQLDVDYFSQFPESLLLFVGDLGHGTKRSDLELVASLAQLRGPALIMPGNNDALHLGALSAELTYQMGRRRILETFKTVEIDFCGYSLHRLRLAGRDYSLISARPCPMGGSDFSFPGLLKERHLVDSLERSAEALRALVDRSEDERLIFLAHNGPRGLGGNSNDIWGRDFSLPGHADSDWGDSDLSDAIAYAKRQGKQVDAVIAGHMHRGRRQNGRPLEVKVDGTLYVNGAVVPRIRGSDQGELHHYSEMNLVDNQLEVSEYWVTLD
ncbi:MAG: metallophosphoesterase [Polyangiaceae bacterium]|nr:metallophosphoesterase [Polyangiaceae bacterium]